MSKGKYTGTNGVTTPRPWKRAKAFARLITPSVQVRLLYGFVAVCSEARESPARKMPGRGVSLKRVGGEGVGVVYLALGCFIIYKENEECGYECACRVGDSGVSRVTCADFLSVRMINLLYTL